MRREIETLTSLRGIAALTVLIFHSVPSFRGYLGVDLFFLLSGFVLAHVYNQIELTPHNYLLFLKIRLARIYPTHLLMLLLLMPMFSRPSFTADGLVASLLLLQSPWHSACWNLASWSISAEWHLYLLFPFLVINYRTRSNKALVVTTAISAAVVSISGWHAGSVNVTNTVMVFLRCLPEFISGIACYFLYQRNALPRWISRDRTFLVTVALLPMLERIQVPDGMMICVLGLLLLASASNQGHGARILNCSLFLYLAYISYSLYMVQGVVVVALWARGIQQGSLLYIVVYFGACCLSAMIISSAIEYPMRNWLRRLTSPITPVRASGV